MAKCIGVNRKGEIKVVFADFEGRTKVYMAPESCAIFFLLCWMCSKIHHFISILFLHLFRERKKDIHFKERAHELLNTQKKRRGGEYKETTKRLKLP